MSSWRARRKFISQRLSSLRQEKCLTHRELAAAVGRSVQVSIRWCSGASCPEPIDLIPLCKLLDVSIGSFYEADISD